MNQKIFACNRLPEELSKEFNLSISTQDSVLSKRRIHISLTNDEEIENKVISYLNNKWKDTSGGHLNDILVNR